MIWDILEHADKVATLAINKVHTPFLDQLWLTLSAKKEWIPLYVVVAVFLIWRLGWKKGLLAILAVVLCVLCVDQFANLIKDLAARLRPSNDPQMIHGGLRMLVPVSVRYRYGFYSAHAGNALGFAVCVSYALRSAKGGRSWKAVYAVVSVLLIAWGLAVGFSRIFVGKHFLGDVLVGFAVGTVFALFISFLASLIARKVSPSAA